MPSLFENNGSTIEVPSDLPVEKSELLFLYESTFSMPNGDPFTGEQRLDEETKRILVSDVRIKRFVRDFLHDMGRDIYVVNMGNRDEDDSESEEESGGKKKSAPSGAGNRVAQIATAYPKEKDVAKLLQTCIDVKLFGGISTAKADNPYFKKNKGYTNISANLTGPVQFALLNPSLNAVDLRMHQNTSVFVSSTDKGRGAIATTTVVPYALCQIHGWINPFVAKQTGLTPNDVSLLLKAMWHSINLANTRTKSNQNSLLLLQVVYADATRKLYGLDRAIKLVCGERDGSPLREEQLRNFDECSLDFSELFEKVEKAGEVVQAVRFYTESDAIRAQLEGRAKFELLAI